jgi:hypothetical protein
MLTVRSCRAAVLGIILATVVNVSFLSLGAQQPPAGALTNLDIVKMASAGLGDAVIIAKIRSSRCEFDTSADALIKLKTSGVSGAILAAMAEAGSPTASAQPSAEATLPSSYGYYVLNGTGFDSLAPSPVRVVAGLQNTSIGANFAVDGFGEDASPRALSSPSPLFLAYQQNIDTSALHLVKLELVSSMQAEEFDIAQITNSGQFDQFRNIYGVARNQPLQVNLWGPRGTEIPLRTEPVPGRAGMFRLSPLGNMQPGRYALYYRNGLHPNLILNYKGSSDQEAVFYLALNSATAPSGETSSSGVVRNESFEGLMRSGQEAFRSSAWDQALTDFQAAAKEDRTGLAWLWTGNARLASGNFSDFGSAWDQALKLNRPLALPVCLAHGISQCQVGTLEVGKAAIRFLSDGRTIFESAPAGVVPQESVQHNVAGYADFKLQIGGKKYNLIFMPYGVECQVLAHVNCRGSGTAQQKAVGDYVEQAVSKLAVPQ